ncbi:MAG: hypothetical protein HY900_26590 [Deltaproteobacteria bacterium]|nr:hypothetical protein [Deltaproteobacteria bacterium]
MDPWNLNTLLICFGGGIVGAAFGGLFSFILCGFLILAGCGIVLAGGSDFVLLQVGLGPVFGPQIGFCGGLAAASYAAGVRKNLVSGTGKDILSPLVSTSWDVLLIGGVWAVFTYATQNVLVKIPVIGMFDCLALSIIVTTLVARLLFHREMPWGSKASIRQHGWLGTDNRRLSWVPWMAFPSRIAVIGLGTGILSGSLAMGAKQILDPLVSAGKVSPTAAFVFPLIIGLSLAAISLTGLNFSSGEIQKFPVWHCQAILSALAFLHFGSLLASAVVGVGAGFLQELMARMFYNHGSDHIDPPATAIALGTFLLNVAHKFLA